jgi:hypothetical protein
MTWCAKDIKDGVVKKKEPELHQGMGRPDGWNNFRREGFNQGIDSQANVKFRLNREKLIDAVLYYNGWNRKGAGEIVDAILAADKEIVELDKEEK